MFHVYKITNKLNGKVYIGKSKDAIKRFRTHIKIAKGGKEKYPRKFFPINAAIAKYGVENFSFEIIIELQTEDEAYQEEEKLIVLNKQNNIPSYNIANGGRSNSGWAHTDETKLRMSKASKGKIHSIEHRRAQSEAVGGDKSFMFGTHLPIFWKERIGKLTAEQVKEIKKSLLEGESGRSISKRYCVSEATISMIKRNKIWTEIIL